MRLPYTIALKSKDRVGPMGRFGELRGSLTESPTPFESPWKFSAFWPFRLFLMALPLSFLPVSVAYAPIKAVSTHTIQASAGAGHGCEGTQTFENDSDGARTEVKVKLWVQSPVEAIMDKGAFQSASGLKTTVVTLEGGQLAAGQTTRIAFQGRGESAGDCEVYRHEVVRAEKAEGDGRRRRQDYEGYEPEAPEEPEETPGEDEDYIETE